MYVSTREFREKYFSEESKPTEMSIRNWIKRGELPGKKLGGMYFVIIENNLPTQVVPENEVEPDFSWLEDS